MNTPNRAGDRPLTIMLEKGKTYAWCACGLSKNQPFCDSSHRTTSITPVIFVAEDSISSKMCMCKQTKNAPFCDGSHKS